MTLGELKGSHQPQAMPEERSWRAAEFSGQDSRKKRHLSWLESGSDGEYNTSFDTGHLRLPERG